MNAVSMGFLMLVPQLSWQSVDTAASPGAFTLASDPDAGVLLANLLQDSLSAKSLFSQGAWK